MSALLRVTACLALFAAACLPLAGCGDTRGLRREQADLETRVARLERDFAALSQGRAGRAEAPGGSGATAAPPPIAPLPVAIDPIAAAAGPPRYALHLASYKRAGDVRRGWDVLTQQFPSVLGALAPQIEAVDFGDGRGTFDRLKAASFSDRAVARAACARLRAGRTYCEVQDDAGTPGDQFWNS
jgi:hypothetical protein